MSASGPGPEWDAECDVGSTGPNPEGIRTECEGTRMRDQPITLSVMTLKGHNGVKREFDVTRIAIQ